ncbi:NAD-dependent epimerase/dehydratase family protein [Burkholderia sp. SIMBA_043]|uniref:NAD-dependent epimerase/dehydratase family protein n=1 Tax=Burkholderia TaxID=32008 RepID=UPI00130DD23E|nr:NAD-dependent epimerase/dehydratase family protein [Burkholderia vietnamiensis]MBH9647663.1 NAD-dependent epimerase/dehydratase family protein [Burkholderia vietnamiensis]MDN8045315.1 NAD-dependent epimerase/dehydratase family protein [Burkholderia vietnamiensis]
MAQQKIFLVTGGTGFLGRALVARLISDGHAVRVSNSKADTPQNSSSNGRLRMDAHVDEWREAIEGCSGIFHLAWSTVPSLANSDPVGDLETNLIGTVRLLEALRKCPDIPLVFASSGGTVYGVAETLPIPEHHPLRPLTAYGASKVAAEQYATLYQRTWNVDARVVRLSNPYGPGQNTNGQLGAASIFAARALANQKIEIWGDGSAIRDYIYIDDAVSGFIAAMCAPRSRFDVVEPVVNIGSGRGVSLREVITLLAHILERPLDVSFMPSRGFDVPASVLDIARAKALLDWNPTISFEEGLSRYIAYLKGRFAGLPGI